MQKRVFALIISLLIITACGTPAASSDQGRVETMVASTLQAYTQSAPTAAPSGLVLTLDGLSLTIPTGLASGAEMVAEPAALPAEDLPWWITYPAHKTYPLQGYLLAESFHKAMIYVYPISDYAAINEGVAATIQSLQELLNNPSQPIPDRLPFLPTWNAGQVFYSNAEFVSFQNGNGIRYITMYSQSPTPIVNSEVFYTYQGLTTDGNYYIAVILPIRHPLLAESGNVDTQPPAGGIPFNWSPEGYEQLQAYVDAVVQLLNSSQVDAFTPNLSSLDGFVHSMLVTAAP